MSGSRLAIVGHRLLQAVPSIIGIIVVTFLLTRALPGDPAAYFAGPAANEESIAQIRAQLGLDKSLPNSSGSMSSTWSTATLEHR